LMDMSHNFWSIRVIIIFVGSLRSILLIDIEKNPKFHLTN
jgi:hypothetical protein